MAKSTENPAQLRSRVTDVIREKLTTREIRPGDPLRLGPLAEAVGMSVTPVREALLLLTHDGWVTHEPNRGFRVAPISRSDIEEIYFIWAMAEAQMAARAATRATARDVAVMRSLDRQINEADPPDGPEAMRLNDQFHKEVFIASDSPKLGWFRQAAFRLVPFRLPAAVEGVSEWGQLNRTAHKPIIDAIAAGDASTAGYLMWRHIQDTSDALLRSLDAIDMWADEDADHVVLADEHTLQFIPTWTRPDSNPIG